jgi:hypothetical protein
VATMQYVWNPAISDQCISVRLTSSRQGRIFNYLFPEFSPTVPGVLRVS